MSDQIDLTQLAKIRQQLSAVDLQAIIDLDPYEAAVDAVLQADIVGRCTTHGMPFYTDEPGCEKVWSVDLCVMVRGVFVAVKDDTE